MGKKSLYKSPAGEKAIRDAYELALSKWPIAHETILIPTRQGETFVLSCGQPAGPPLILLHGAGSNSAIWMEAAQELGGIYQLYCVDLIGEPGKSAPSRPDWNGPAFSEWLEDVIGFLKLDKVILCGISQGGWASLKFAVNHPGQVEKLILLSPGGVVPDKPSFLLKVIFLSLMGKWGSHQINRLIFADQPLTQEVEDYITLINRQFIPRMGILPIFKDEELARLKMPTLLIMGDKDVLRDYIKINQRLQSLLPDYAFNLIAGAGHAITHHCQSLMGPFLGFDQGKMG